MSDDQMSPDASPGAVGKKAGVRRVNNWPTYLVIGGLGAFLLIMGLVAMDRANQQPTANGPSEKGGNTSQFATEIVNGRDGGEIPAYTAPVIPAIPEPDAPPAPPQSQGGVAVVRPENMDAPPMPPSAPTGGNRTAQDDEEQRIRQMKLQQFGEAVKAKTAVKMDPARSPGSATGTAGQGNSQADLLARIAEARRMAESARNTDPTTAYKQRLAQLQADGTLQQAAAAGGGSGYGGGSSGMQLASARGQSSSSRDLGQFDNRQGGDRWELNSEVQKPRTPFELRAGYVIPGTLISGINSDLPGQIVAQVSQDVMDTPTGRHLLIPQGSRLVGSYSADVAYGQSRVLVAWQRIVFPDGKALDIGSMPGGDQAGYAGFNDKVNSHFFKVISSALLMSAVTAGVSISQDSGQSSGFGQQQTASSAMSEALGQQLGQVTAQLISKNLNVSPTLEIRPGYRFNVIVTKDITFTKPYKSFDY